MGVRVSMRVREREDVDSCVSPALESLLKPDKVTLKVEVRGDERPDSTDSRVCVGK